MVWNFIRRGLVLMPVIHMNFNPYESPQMVPVVVERKDRGSQESRTLFSVAAIAWGLLLLFGLPAVQQIPVGLRWGSTLITIVLMATNLYVSSRWLHLALLAPLFVILGVLQYLVWIFTPWM